MKRTYWSTITSPFQTFAAWVDDEGRLVRFNLRATGQPGRLVEFNPTQKMFTSPDDPATEDYIAGRFG